ncbi:MAG: leucyl aminopeptidase [Euryarchaeota archaeon]|nr:leucyl aminopeptidase [Euryarchaeota archaeon]
MAKMKVEAKADAAKKTKDGVVAVPLFAKEKGKTPKLEGVQKTMDDASEGRIKAAYDDGAFTGSKGETHVVRLRDVRFLLVGLGERKKVDLEALRQAGAAATKRTRKLEAKRYVSLLHAVELEAKEGETAPDVSERAEAVAFGCVLGAYKFDRFFSKEKKEKDEKDETEVEAVVFSTTGAETKAVAKGADRGRIIAEATALCRDFANSPPNVATPRWMADQARRVAREGGLRIKVLGKPEITRHKMGGLLGVSQGSTEPPRLVLMEYKPRKVSAKPWKKIAFVGKGITFDSGGISIKPSPSMDEMKFDKCGGCAVVAAMQAIAALKPEVHVIGVAAFSENLPSGKAYKPGDILRMASGKTVEVLNTDAEGRLILGDALWYVQREKPDVIIDFATLTGAIDIALGKPYSGLMGSDDELIDRLYEIGKRSGEKLWRMPLGDEYQEMIKGTYADIKNIGGRGGGALTAGQFLRNFIEEDKVKWAHLDIAATAWGDGDNPYTPKGATGVGVRTMVSFLDSLLDGR